MAVNFSALHEFFQLFDRMSGEVAHSCAHGAAGRDAFPALNIGEDCDTLYVRALVPGVGADDIELVITDTTILLRGERGPAQGRYYRQERPTGSFQRMITVGVPIDRDAVKATLRNGVLEVKLPKVPRQRSQATKIDIR